MLLACYAAADSPLTRLTVWVALMPLSTLRLIIWDLSKVIQTETETGHWEELNCFQVKMARISHSSRNQIQQSTIRTSAFNKHAVLCITNANVWSTCYDLHSRLQLGHELNEQLYHLINQKIFSYPRWDSNVFCVTIGDIHYNWNYFINI